MVASLSALKSTGAAASYYSQVDDYYRSSDMAPTQWAGRGADALGLHGEVDAKTFTQLLEGHLRDGEQLGRPDGKGGLEHRPGWDMTFSAPKSVSALALAGGDERLIRAHESAVAAALAHVEHVGAAHQLHGESPVGSENLVIAQFRHATSREQQPQLHTHSVILNMTQDQGGRWRSLESRPLFRLQKEAGLIYRSELAKQCRDLGYEIAATKVGKEAGFEIRSVPDALLAHWSERARQIEAELATKGQTRASASAAAKEVATLASRAHKGEIDHVALREAWKDTAVSYGADLERRISHSRGQEHSARAATRDAARDTARAAVAFASEKLAERDARFSERDLLAETRKAAFGKATEADLRLAINDMKTSGELISREARGYDAITGRKLIMAGYTTPQAMATERNLLRAAERMAGHGQAICDPAAAKAAIATVEARTGHAFNQSQRTATQGLLTSQNGIHLVQGYAGTAKTTSVLATVAAELARQGQTVRALAPSASAAQTLGTAIGAEGMTAARHLLEQERGASAAGRQTWIVDEASLLSAKDMARLLTQAERQQARVILVGDVKQLGSVEAGSAFRQLQEQTSLRTHVLDEIVRQRNALALEAVHASIGGDARSALQAIDRAGVVQAVPDRSARINALVEDYMRLSVTERQSALIVALGRDDRQEINTTIRTALHELGELHGAKTQVSILVGKDQTRPEMRQAESFTVGDVVRFGRDYQRLGMTKGEYATVTAVDLNGNRLTVRNEVGHEASFNPRTHGKLEAFSVEQREIQVGERLRMTRNDRDLGRTNGEQMKVERIDGHQIQARDARGQLHILDVGRLRDSHLEHAYCSTAYAAQGQTADRVFVHAESFRTNLATQQSFYVTVSRARDEVRIYTDDRERLISQVERESGQKSQALERSAEISEREADSHRSAHVSSGREVNSAQERDYAFE